MRIPQLQIQTTKAQIGLTIQQPEQKIEQQPAELQISQPAAELHIVTTEGQLQIDQTQLRADLGSFTFIELARKAAQKGEEDILQGIARRAREGRQLGDIRKGQNAIAAIAASKNENMQQKQLGIKFIPSFHAVELNYIPAKVEINVQPKKTANRCHNP
ncbi:DUF6470 family protein [Lysinibacillus boronitolerans]|uniref:DUF6470 family protein n=1 Tax=Lysinibacillus boronitolerans TaxID=309788 RepID=UPI00031818C2|nr:DUF6470 family protein [Lysinibacillus boronitolerans]